MQNIEEFIKRIAIKAGEIALEYYGHTTILRFKENAVAIVTEADLAVEKYLSEEIKTAFPDHGIYAEESGEFQGESEYIWYLDPIDGTKNFQSKVPLFGINIGLAYKGELINAAINLPVLRELAIATKGRGAILYTKREERKMICSQKVDWTNIYGIGAIKQTEQHVKFFNYINNLSDNSAWVNGIASPAVSAIWTADGRRDWYVSIGKNSWDFAAPYLIAKESGLKVSTFDGTEWKPGSKGIIMSNKILHPQFVEAAKLAYL